jgi:hypothetical protein
MEDAGKDGGTLRVGVGLSQVAALEAARVTHRGMLVDVEWRNGQLHKGYQSTIMEGPEIVDSGVVWEPVQGQPPQPVRINALTDLAKAVILFHDAFPWTPEKTNRWRMLTGTDGPTTRNLCEAARKALGES